jgi:hypothetical protein
MKTGMNRSVRLRQRDQMLKPIFRLSPWVWGLCCLVVFMAAPMTIVNSQVQQNGGLPNPPRDASGIPPLSPLINRHPDANRILEDAMKSQDNRKRFAELNLQRQKQMTDETAKLLQLAGELKAETVKSDKDTVSILEVRKAELIEKLARSVRDQMKASVATE